VDWTRVVDLPLEQDLSPLCQYLYSRGVQHRVTEESGRQVLWVTDQAMAAPVADLLTRWLNGSIDFQVSEPSTGGGLSREDSEAGSATHGPFNWRRVPWTLILLGLSVLGLGLVSVNESLSWVRWLTYQDFIIREEYIGFRPVAYNLVHGQWWRFITPIFLHFSIFHLLFNGLWLWELGRRIEALEGGWGLLKLVFVIALLSNTTQYVWQGASLFGGMSGVIYGLLGYIWWRHRLSPHPYLDIPPGIIVFMLVWLVVCMTGAIGWFADVKIANGAHVGGLLVGVGLGALAGRRRAR